MAETPRFQVTPLPAPGFRALHARSTAHTHSVADGSGLRALPAGPGGVLLHGHRSATRAAGHTGGRAGGKGWRRLGCGQ